MIDIRGSACFSPEVVGCSDLFSAQSWLSYDAEEKKKGFLKS